MGQAYTHADPTWPQFPSAAAGSSGDSIQQLGHLYWRLKSVGLPTGEVSVWTDDILGVRYTNSGSARPSNNAQSTGLFVNKFENDKLYGNTTVTVAQTPDAANDFAIYCIFRPYDLPSGVYYPLFLKGGGVVIGIHPTGTINLSSDDHWGVTVPYTSDQRIQCFVSNEGYYGTNRGRWLNGATNATTTLAYPDGARFTFDTDQLFADNGSYFYFGWVYEMGLMTNKTLWPSNALSVWQYATNTYGLYGVPIPTWTGASPLLNGNLLSAYDPSNIVAAVNGDTVTSIPDSGPYAYHMRTTNSPKFYVDASTNNGLPHIAFNIFGMSGQQAGTNYTTVFNQPTTIFMVFDSTGAGTAEGTYDFFIDNCDVPGGGGTDQAIYKTSANQNIAAGSTVSNGHTDFSKPMVYEFYFDGASSYIKTNGTISFAGNGGSNGRRGFALAGSRGWDTAYMSPMNFYGAWAYTNLSSTVTRSNIMSYLGWRFRQPVLIP